MQTIRVALADDHPLILKIVRQELARAGDISIVWESGAVNDLLTLITRQMPDVLMLDLSFSGHPFDPSAFVRDLKTRFPKIHVLILTAYDDPVWIDELLSVGVSGYIVKSDDFSLRLVDAVRAVAQGRTFLSTTAVMGLMAARRHYTLTDRERAILRLATQGHANVEIAGTLGISHGTVRNHLSNIYAKLGVDNRDAAVRAAEGLRELPRANANQRRAEPCLHRDAVRRHSPQVVLRCRIHRADHHHRRADPNQQRLRRENPRQRIDTDHCRKNRERRGTGGRCVRNHILQPHMRKRGADADHQGREDKPTANRADIKPRDNDRLRPRGKMERNANEK